MHICIYTCTCIYIYTYIYIYTCPGSYANSDDWLLQALRQLISLRGRGPKLDAAVHHAAPWEGAGYNASSGR